jgi:AraC family transcriptional regulator of adaptative response/methylated-DNA-[protein]-cysteine methyltransferase
MHGAQLMTSSGDHQLALALPSARVMQRALREGDATYDGVFYAGVRTTGIFCRPSCPARKPRPEHVEFFASVRQALAAGYRACKRCRPLAVGAPPPFVSQLISTVEEDPARRLTETDLKAMGIDPARARRAFQRHYGITFQAFCRAMRLGEALTGLRQGASVDDAVFDSGYESHSGFRAAFARVFGSPPARAAEAGPHVTLAWIDTPLGPMIAGAKGEQGICLLEFSDRRALEAQLAALQRRLRAPLVPGREGGERSERGGAHVVQLRDELARYFAGELRRFEVPLALAGSPFQERVWRELLTIPHGETCCYEELARRAGRPGAARAVGTANGQNPIAILVPCHRVVNKDGALGGYGGGLWRKRRLLELERSAPRG